MENIQLFKNVSAGLEMANKAGVYTIQESSVIYNTLVQLVDVLGIKEQLEAEHKASQEPVTTTKKKKA